MSDHEKALSCLKDGRLAEAEAIWLALAKAAPGDPAPPYFLGVVRLQQGRFEEALALSAASLRLKPQARAFMSQAFALQAMGRLEDALAGYGQALELAPELADAFYNRGVLLAGLGRSGEALDNYDRALALQGDDAALLGNRSALLLELGRLDDALDDARKAAAIDPHAPEAWNQYGIALHALGRHDDAMQALEKALALRPDYADAFYCVGLLHKDMGAFGSALAALDRALALNPHDAAAWNHRGVTLYRLERFDAAQASFEKALAIRPDYADALSNRARLLQKSRSLERALQSYDAFLALRPDQAQAWADRGTVLCDLQRFDDAIASYDRALARDPDNLDALRGRGNLVWAHRRDAQAAIGDLERAVALNPDYGYVLGDLFHLRMQAADWQDHDAMVARIDREALAGKRAIQPFYHLMASDDPAAHLASALTYARHLVPPAAAPALHRDRGHARIRVGYVCGEFREHPIGFLCAGLYEQHDQSRFDFVAFDNGWDDGSLTHRRARAAFGKFIPIASLSDQEVIQRIRDEEIDILVDVNGHTRNQRMQVFAHRPAPVQVNWQGYAGSTGAPYLDYIIIDPLLAGPGDDQFYSEQVVRLPECYQPGDDRRPRCGPPPTRAACGLPEQGLVFANFNHIHKITPAMFSVWMSLLRAAPGSVLWLLGNNPVSAGNLRRQAEARGVAGARILFAPMTSQEKHMDRLQLADLMLDTLPYNAHTTASDALWAGVPMATCRGRSFASRVASSILCATGLPELVTHDLPSYEALLLGLAREPGRIAALRKKLAAQIHTAPMFDTARYARHMESAYQTMWERWRRGEPARGFAVPPLPAGLDARAGQAVPAS